MTERAAWLVFPDDVWAEIARFLCVGDVLLLRHVCRQLRGISLLCHVNAQRNDAIAAIEHAAATRAVDRNTYAEAVLSKQPRAVAQFLDSVAVYWRLEQAHEHTAIDMLLCGMPPYTYQSYFTIQFIQVPAALRLLASRTTPMNDRTYCAQLFYRAVRLGSFACALHVADVLSIEPAEVRALHNRALIAACEMPDLSIARWLVTRFELRADDLRDNCQEILQTACLRGRREVVSWLVNEFHFGRLDFMSIDGYPFQEVCSGGYLALAQYLADVLPVQRDDVILNNNRALRRSCTFGRFDVVVWLVTRFQLTREDVRTRRNDALVEACCFRHLQVARWLFDYFDLSFTDLCDQDNRALRTAQAQGWTDVVDWIEEQRHRASGSLTKSK